MIRLPHNHQHFLFDKTLAPAVTVKPGTEVAFDTLDACCGEVRTTEQFLYRRTTSRKSNPLTGPVFIEGAQPGHTLVVDILDAVCDSTGFQLIGPDRGIIANEVPDWTCYVVKVNDGVVQLGDEPIRVPAVPVIGSFGNAPRGQPTNEPNRLGGNMDIRQVRKGARLYLPVEVPGALFSLGDVHACQGDGEVVGAPEIGATVTVKFDLLPYRFSDWFMFEDAENWYAPWSAATEAEAAKHATLHNARFMTRTYGLSFEKALILLTWIGRLHISRTGKWGPHQPVVCSVFSKEEARRAVTI